MRRNTSLAADDPLARIDFNAWYRREFLRSSFGRRSAADWDRRASHRHRFDSRSDYNRAFLGCMDLTDVGTALDIASGVRLGPGKISVHPAKLGLAGHGFGLAEIEQDIS